MERKPIILSTDYLNKKLSNLYYKKIIYRKKQLRNNKSYSMKKKNHNSKQNSLNIKPPIIMKSHKSFYPLLNTENNKINKTNKTFCFPYKNLNSIILIQKFIRGLLIRKKMAKFSNLESKKKTLSQTANPKRFQKKMNINLFDAIRRNSKNQKNSIKLANNKFNLRNTVNNKINKIRAYKKHIIYINKSITKKKNFSFDHNKVISKSEPELLTKMTKINNKNKNNNTNLNKNENQNSINESDFSMSNLFTEQYPQNLNTNENEINKNIANNLKINDEFLENNKVCQTEENDYLKNSNKNKKNNMLTGISSYQTKENSSSDRNITLENYNNIYAKKSNNKQKQIRDIKNENKKIIFNRKKVFKNDIKEKEEDNNNLDFSIDYNPKDEFDSDTNFQLNKKNINFINANIKYNFNPMINSKLSLKNININKKINSNCYNNFNNLYGNISNKDKKISGGIKEDKKGDNDLISLKSSFYDEDEFIIINYDYTLNDKKKLNINSLKISSVETINIKGRRMKKTEFLEKLIDIIHKNISKFLLNFLKKLGNDDEDEEDKSITDNESCTYIPKGRIEKNRIIFDFAQNDMKYIK